MPAQAQAHPLPVSGAAAAYRGAQYLRALGRARAAGLHRAEARASELAERVEISLGQYRASPLVDRRDVNSPIAVSLSLDRFVAQARTAVELALAAGAPTQIDIERLEGAVKALNGVYVANEGAIHSRSIAPKSFMLGAESLVRGALEEVGRAVALAKRHRAEAEEAAARQHVRARQAVDTERHMQGHLQDSRRAAERVTG